MSKKYGAAWKSCQGKLNQRRHGPTSHNVENSTTAAAAAAATSTRVSCHIVWGSENEDSGPSARPFVLLSSCLETLNTHYKTADRKAKPKPRYHMSAAPAWGIWELPTTRWMCNTCCCCCSCCCCCCCCWRCCCLILAHLIGWKCWVLLARSVRTFVLP